MKILTAKSTFKIAILLSSIAAIFVSGCSDDEKPKELPPQTQESSSGEKLISKDSPHDATPEAENSQKQKFVSDFSSQCINRELNNSANKIEDATLLTKECECIAAYIAKDLTDEEAEKFNQEHENPQSIRIKYEAAAYECIQEKAKVNGPSFAKPQAE
jgi:hypothetical protein